MIKLGKKVEKNTLYINNDSLLIYSVCKINKKNLATTYFPGKVYSRVSSASKGLTSVFGMGTGISP